MTGPAAGATKRPVGKFAKVASRKGFQRMSRLSLLSSPLLLGFEEVERLLDRAGKGSGDGYPPYNVERIAPKFGSDAGGETHKNGGDNNGSSAGEILRITLAVAGFTREELEIILKDSQLVVRGRQQEDKSRDYLYRGIAARQFTRTFVLAEGIEVRSANLVNGLLAIDLERPEPQRVARTITIGDRKLQT
jgi:HSP20 family molecular chaperone IbpA